VLVLSERTGLNSSPVLNLGLIPTQHEKKNPVDKKSRDGKLEPIHKKYKANKSMRTHVMKEHNNQDTTNTCKDNTGL